MAVQCPWSGFTPATLGFCEERLCGWIVEPSNTWSNLSYIFLGLWILWTHRKDLSNILASIGLTSVLVGSGSFAFHATATWWGEFLDVSGMFLISGQFITFAIKRQFKWKNSSLFLFYIVLCTLSMLTLWNFRKVGIPLFTLQVTTAGILELWMFFKRRPPTQYKYMGLLVISFCIAFSAWILDITRIACIPSNHFITGHAIWHLANTFSLYYFYRFNQQFADHKQ